MRSIGKPNPEAENRMVVTGRLGGWGIVIRNNVSDLRDERNSAEPLDNINEGRSDILQK